MCSRVSSDRVEAAWCVVVIAVVIAGDCGALWRLVGGDAGVEE